MRHSQRALSRIRRMRSRGTPPKPNGSPQKHPRLGSLAPGADAVAQALAGRDVVRLQPSGAYAANLFGLSEHGDTSGDTWPLCVPTNGGTARILARLRRRDGEWRWS